MPEQKSPERVASDLAPLPPRRELLAADKEDLVERLESLHQDLQRRLEVEEEILHLNLQKGTASLQTQVEEAARRFRAATQELEAFRLEILQAEGDPSAAAPKPYVFEDLSSAGPAPGPDRAQLRSLLSAFRRLRDGRDRLGREAEQARADLARGQAAAEKSAAELATMGVTLADLESARTHLQHDLDAAHTESSQLRAELAREKFAAERNGSELERLKIELTDVAGLRADLEREKAAGEKTTAEISTLMGEVADLEDEREKMEKDLAEARGRSERVREELEQATVSQERAVEETTILRRSKSSLESELERLRASLAEAEATIATLTEDHGQLGRTLAFEQARTEQVAAEATQVLEKLAETERRLAEAEAAVATLSQDQSDLGGTLASEQAKTELASVEATSVREKLAEAETKIAALTQESEQTRERLAETMKKLQDSDQQTEGYEKLVRFLQKVRLKALLDKNVKSAPVPGRQPSAELLVEFVASTIGAQEHPLHGARSLPVKIVRPMKKPGLGELRQFIEELPQADLEGVKRVHDSLRTSFFALSKKQEHVAVDIDTLELVIGSRPRPAQSYWPLIAYVPELQEFWNGKLRTSTDGKPKELIDFLTETLLRAPASLDRSRLRFRLDGRFFNEQALRLLELRKCSYVAAAPDSPALRASSRACVFTDLEGGWEAAEWTAGGRPSRAFQARYAVLRHPRGAQAAPSLPFLFRDAQHAYYVFAIDKKISPWQALEFYSGRGASEETEHALLRDFCVNRLLARGAHSHATFLHLFLLSADLVRWHSR